MANQVIFDGQHRIMRVLANVEVLNILALYNEWKIWSLQDENSMFLHAFTVVGGEPIIGDNTITRYFFLTNGWKLKPAEADHTLSIEGIILSDTGPDVFIPTDGGYTVSINAIMPVFATSTINYGEIQRKALEDMVEVFFDTALKYKASDMQTIRDAFTLSPTPELDPTLRSIDTIMERIDNNTQVFGKRGPLKVEIDPTSFNSKFDLISNKIDSVKDTILGHKAITIDIGTRIDTITQNLYAINTKSEIVKNQVSINIPNKLDVIDSKLG